MDDILKIGCHLSISKGFLHIAEEAVSIGANTFQFFTRNPQGGKGKEWQIEDIKQYQKFAKEQCFGQILAHAPYTLNPCSKESETRKFAEICMIDDLRKMEMIPDNYYNFHPGSHTGIGVNEGIKYIANLLNKVLDNVQSTTILLETMSGKGTEIGRSFEELAEIITLVEQKDKIGVCLDSCHVYSAGYDIVNSLDNVLEKFDKIIGLSKLKAVHLNDSKMPFASNKDRHEKIGQGSIGEQSLINLVNRLIKQKCIFILETPNDNFGYRQEIALFREKITRHL